MRATKPRHDQLDLAAFIDACPTRSAARVASRFNTVSWAQAETEGLTLDQADRLAGHLRLHPADLWPVWVDLAAAESRRPCAADGCPEMFIPNPTGRGANRVYCSRNCAARMRMRRVRATEAGQVANRRYSKAYKAYLRDRRAAA